MEDFKKVLARRKCKPIIVSNAGEMSRVNRRKYFRVKFIQMLEADMSILEINKKKINVGNTKVLVKNMGPGGLCFVSNIKLPVDRGIVLQFTQQLLGEEIIVRGYSV